MIKIPSLKNLFPSKSKTEAAPATPSAPTLAETMPILFYKDSNGHIIHGSIYVTHASFNLKNVPVSYAFRDLIDPPALTPEIMAHIWDMAEREGYIVHELRSAASVSQVQPPPRMQIQGNPTGRQGVSRQLRRPSGDRERPPHRNNNQGHPKAA